MNVEEFEECCRTESEARKIALALSGDKNCLNTLRLRIPNEGTCLSVKLGEYQFQWNSNWVRLL